MCDGYQGNIIFLNKLFKVYEIQITIDLVLDSFDFNSILVFQGYEA